MQNENYGRVIDLSTMLAKLPTSQRPDKQPQGRTLLLEPRTIRHQERVEDLFYLLFRRTGA